MLAIKSPCQLLRCASYSAVPPWKACNYLLSILRALDHGATYAFRKAYDTLNSTEQQNAPGRTRAQDYDSMTMTTSGNRMSTFTTASGTSEGKNGEQKKDLWTSLLEDTKGKSGKKLAEKNLLVLGMRASAKLGGRRNSGVY